MLNLSASRKQIMLICIHVTCQCCQCVQESLLLSSLSSAAPVCAGGPLVVISFFSCSSVCRRASCCHFFLQLLQCVQEGLLLSSLSSAAPVCAGGPLVVISFFSCSSVCRRASCCHLFLQLLQCVQEGLLLSSLSSAAPVCAGGPLCDLFLQLVLQFLDFVLQPVYLSDDTRTVSVIRANDMMSGFLNLNHINSLQRAIYLHIYLLT